MLFETEKSMSLELSLWYFLDPMNVLDEDCLIVLLGLVYTGNPAVNPFLHSGAVI